MTKIKKSRKENYRNCNNKKKNNSTHNNNFNLIALYGPYIYLVLSITLLLIIDYDSSKLVNGQLEAVSAVLSVVPVTSILATAGIVGVKLAALSRLLQVLGYDHAYLANGGSGTAAQPIGLQTNYAYMFPYVPGLNISVKGEHGSQYQNMAAGQKDAGYSRKTFPAMGLPGDYESQSSPFRGAETLREIFKDSGINFRFPTQQQQQMYKGNGQKNDNNDKNLYDNKNIQQILATTPIHHYDIHNNHISTSSTTMKNQNNHMAPNGHHPALQSPPPPPLQSSNQHLNNNQQPQHNQPLLSIPTSFATENAHNNNNNNDPQHNTINVQSVNVVADRNQNHNSNLNNNQPANLQTSTSISPVVVPLSQGQQGQQQPPQLHHQHSVVGQGTTSQGTQSRPSELSNHHQSTNHQSQLQPSPNRHQNTQVNMPHPSNIRPINLNFSQNNQASHNQPIPQTQPPTPTAHPQQTSSQISSIIPSFPPIITSPSSFSVAPSRSSSPIEMVIENINQNNINNPFKPKPQSLITSMAVATATNTANSMSAQNKPPSSTNLNKPTTIERNRAHPIPQHDTYYNSYKQHQKALLSGTLVTASSTLPTSKPPITFEDYVRNIFGQSDRTTFASATVDSPTTLNTSNQPPLSPSSSSLAPPQTSSPPPSSPSTQSILTTTGNNFPLPVKPNTNLPTGNVINSNSIIDGNGPGQSDLMTTTTNIIPTTSFEIDGSPPFHDDMEFNEINLSNKRRRRRRKRDLNGKIVTGFGDQQYQPSGSSSPITSGEANNSGLSDMLMQNSRILSNGEQKDLSSSTTGNSDGNFGMPALNIYPSFRKRRSLREKILSVLNNEEQKQHKKIRITRRNVHH